jgi:4-amino-4-deoxy-L-arabinose transferase-like glycosyltransferase
MTTSAGRPPLARGPVLAPAAAALGLLLAVSGRYGYDRDELYFLQAGRHLAWGYPDQPPAVPLLARGMSLIAAGSVVVLRVPSLLAAAGIVVLTGVIARELGGGRAEQGLAASCAAVSAVLLATCHLLSTSAFDLLAWTALCALLVRPLLGGDPRLWVAAGGVAGVGLLANPLVATLGIGVLAGVVLAGPREVLRDRWLWAGAVLAGLIASPYLAWQAGHSWPQLAMSRAIAAGSSGTSTPRALFLPFQLVLVSPVLVPVWVAGLRRLFRDPALRRLRCLGWAYPVLAALFVITGGKPYYLAGLYPLLLAAGAGPAIRCAAGAGPAPPAATGRSGGVQRRRGRDRHLADCAAGCARRQPPG